MNKSLFRIVLPLVALLTLALAACATQSAQSSQSTPPFKPGGGSPPVATATPITPPPPTATLTPTAVAVPPTATPIPTATVAVPTDHIIDTAEVERTDILILESMPVQVHLVARGYFPDGCTTLHKITQQRNGNTFTVTITTQRPEDAMCNMIIVPFEETIPLEVRGLPAGTYTVITNGVSNTFTLDTDNTAQPATP